MSKEDELEPYRKIAKKIVYGAIGLFASFLAVVFALTC
jgi:hypothetical protein